MCVYYCSTYLKLFADQCFFSFTVQNVEEGYEQQDPQWGHESGEPGGDGRGCPTRLQRVGAVRRAQGWSLLEKLLHEAGRRLKYVRWGPEGVGKSTLAR